MRFRIVWLSLGGVGDWWACVRDPLTGNRRYLRLIGFG